MRICVIGNSHSAATKLAWDGGLSKIFNGVEMVFFPVPSQHVNLSMEAGKLSIAKPRSRKKLMKLSGGLAYVDPAVYDAMLLVGFGGNVTRLTGLRPKPSRRHLTVACVRRCLRDYITAIPAMTILDQLRSVSDRPIVVVPAPLTASGILQTKPGKKQYSVAEKENAEFVQVGREEYETCCQNRGASSVWQPQTTIVKGMFTKPRFAVNALRLKSVFGGDLKNPQLGDLHREDDFFHMNAEFGAIMLELALRKLLSNDSHLLPPLNRSQALLQT